MNESNYGKLIHAFDDDNDYAAFLDKTSKLVRTMMQEGSINMNDAPHIMRSYDNDSERIAGGKQIVAELENYCLNHFDRMTAEQASELIIMCCHCIESAELVEVCERIIGNNVDFLHEECGISFVLEVLLGFGQSKFSR